MRLRPALTHWAAAPLALLLFILAAHLVGALADFRASIASPIEGDYGEGIVWQQAALIFSERAYSPSQALPFIVFHYPPLYHVVVRLVAGSDPNLLAAGRLVSAVATVSLAPLVAALVLLCTVGEGGRIKPGAVISAVVAGLLILCLHAVRTWGLYMRVDMLALALSMAGLAVGMLGNGRFWPTLLGLLLCVASVYTKQSQLSAGIALGLVAVLRRPRSAIPAALVAGLVGLGVLAWLQHVTSGGFWQHVFAYNQNRFAARHLFWVFWPERFVFPVMVLMLVAAVVAAVTWRRISGRGMSFLQRVRRSDFRTNNLLTVLAAFACSSGMAAFSSFKSGSTFNYVIEWQILGCVLIGLLIDRVVFETARHARWASIMLCVMAISAVYWGRRNLDDAPDPLELATQRTLVELIAIADKPVLSENMTLIMQAGKSVVVEPAIVTELAERGQWDERHLVEMVRTGAFAFVIGTDHGVRRTDPVDAALHATYLRVVELDKGMSLYTPAN